MAGGLHRTEDRTEQWDWNWIVRTGRAVIDGLAFVSKGAVVVEEEECRAADQRCSHAHKNDASQRIHLCRQHIITSAQIVGVSHAALPSTSQNAFIGCNKGRGDDPGIY